MTSLSRSEKVDGNSPGPEPPRARLLKGALAGILALPVAGIGGAVIGLLAWYPASVISENMQGMNGPVVNVLRRPVPLAILVVVATWFAARTAVRICAAVSGRPSVWIGPRWMLIGTPWSQSASSSGTGSISRGHLSPPRHSSRWRLALAPCSLSGMGPISGCCQRDGPTSR